LLRDETIVITGAAGQVALPIAESLAAQNRVVAVDLFPEEETVARLSARGAECVRQDLQSQDLSALPEEASYVMNFAVFAAPGSDDFERAMAVNALAPGRLLARFSAAKGFLYCSSTAVYRYQGHRPLCESDPIADRMAGPFPVYSMSKVAGENVVRFAAEQYGVPTTIARLNLPYGANGGMPAAHMSAMLRGEAILLHPDRPNYFNPIAEEDFIRQASLLVQAGSVPARLVNWCGSERVSVEEYCAYMGELLGVEPRFEYSSEAMGSLCCDTSAVTALIGATRVGWKQGFREMVEARPSDSRLA
jgi:nucleoside-diphosphate-sugar epimerase